MDGIAERYRAALAERTELRSPRLLLRLPSEQDIPQVIVIAGDWQVASRLARMPHPYGAAEARFFLDEVVPAELVWAIVDRQGGRLLGVIGLALHDGASSTVELGYYIGRGDWGRGIATEAGSVVLAYAIGLVGRAAIRSGFFVDNPASGRVLEKLASSATASPSGPASPPGPACHPSR